MLQARVWVKHSGTTQWIGENRFNSIPQVPSAMLGSDLHFSVSSDALEYDTTLLLFQARQMCAMARCYFVGADPEADTPNDVDSNPWLNVTHVEVKSDEVTVEGIDSRVRIPFQTIKRWADATGSNSETRVKIITKTLVWEKRETKFLQGTSLLGNFIEDGEPLQLQRHHEFSDKEGEGFEPCNPGFRAVMKGCNSAEDHMLVAAKHARGDNTTVIDCGRISMASAEIGTDFSGENQLQDNSDIGIIPVKATVIAIEDGSNENAKSQHVDAVCNLTKTGAFKKPQGPGATIKSEDILYDRLTRGLCLTPDEMKEKISNMQYIGKGGSSPHHIPDRVMGFIVSQKTPRDFFGPITIKEAIRLEYILMEDCSILVDSGDLCGPGTAMDKLRAKLKEEGREDVARQIETEPANLQARYRFIHGSHNNRIDGALNKDKAPRVDMSHISSHSVSGFTGGSVDDNPVVREIRLWLMDIDTGLLYATPFIYTYLMRQWMSRRISVDNLCVALGQCNLAQMQY